MVAFSTPVIRVHTAKLQIFRETWPKSVRYLLQEVYFRHFGVQSPMLHRLKPLFCVSLWPTPICFWNHLAIGISLMKRNRFRLLSCFTSADTSLAIALRLYSLEWSQPLYWIICPWSSLSVCSSLNPYCRHSRSILTQVWHFVDIFILFRLCFHPNCLIFNSGILKNQNVVHRSLRKKLYLCPMYFISETRYNPSLQCDDKYYRIKESFRDVHTESRHHRGHECPRWESANAFVQWTDKGGGRHIRQVGLQENAF